MYKDQLDKILVVWVNTGAAYPDVQRYMAKLSQKIPHFLTVRGKQPENIAKNGFPSDVVPIRYSQIGRHYVKSAESFKIQSAFDCCSQNMWQPLQQAMRMLGIKKIIRGQRRDEEYVNTDVVNGTVIDGIEYTLPLENWTAAQVFEYLKKNDVEFPPYYGSETTSHDCWNCTAYLSSYQKRIQNLPPEPRAEVERRLNEINTAIELELAPLKRLIGK
jgi:3'-phosphoadenosine 5'-phosphosulfate sulfotransferase (PAPS reductase)/FAD synthetase